MAAGCKDKEGSMSQEGFFTSLDVAILFYRTCNIYKIKDERQRIALMRKIVARGKAKYIRDPQKFLADKTVIKVQPKETK